jgi:predicted membrane protein (TIGR00267 family)
VSGFYGSYLVERAERDRAMRELEESTLSSLEDTAIASASRYATIVIALIDGASPFGAALIAMIPFAFVGVVSMHAAYYLAVAVGLAELFCLGLFLGSISRDRLWYSGIKLVLAGVIALVISLLLGGGLG